MIQYAAASKKDASDVSNRQLLNLSIQGLKLQKKAEASAIRTLESKDWWPKYIAKILYEKTGGYNRAQARAFSRKVILGRVVAVGFMKFFFLKMAQVVGPSTGRPARAGKAFAGFTANFQKATPSKPDAGCVVSYPYRKRTQKTALKTERLLNNALQRAIGATVRDIQIYIDGKMGKTARKYSAKGI
jgi:hypothetical protein